MGVSRQLDAERPKLTGPGKLKRDLTNNEVNGVIARDVTGARPCVAPA